MRTGLLRTGPSPSNVSQQQGSSLPLQMKNIEEYT